MDSVNPATMYAAIYEGGVFKTTDGGSKWTFAGFEGQLISALTADPRNPDTLYAGITPRVPLTCARLSSYDHFTMFNRTAYRLAQ